MVRELELQVNYLAQEPVKTIYLGRHPSLLSGSELDALLNTIYKHYPVLPKAEITLEANPDDLTAEKLRILATAGVNRLSIGIQSFDNAILGFLNRAHTADEAIRCIEGAHRRYRQSEYRHYVWVARTIRSRFAQRSGPSYTTRPQAYFCLLTHH